MALTGGGGAAETGDVLGFSFLESSRGSEVLPWGQPSPWAGVKTSMKPGWPKGGSSRGLWSSGRGWGARLSLKPQGLVLKDGGTVGARPAPASVVAGVRAALWGGAPAERVGGSRRLGGSLQDGRPGSSPLSSAEGGSSWDRCSGPGGTGVAAGGGRGTRLARPLTGGAGLAASSAVGVPCALWAWAADKGSASEEARPGEARASFRRLKTPPCRWSCAPGWSGPLAGLAGAAAGVALTAERLSGPTRPPGLSGCSPLAPPWPCGLSARP